MKPENVARELRCSAMTALRRIAAVAGVWRAGQGRRMEQRMEAETAADGCTVSLERRSFCMCVSKNAPTCLQLSD